MKKMILSLCVCCLIGAVFTSSIIGLVVLVSKIPHFEELFKFAVLFVLFGAISTFIGVTVMMKLAKCKGRIGEFAKKIGEPL